MPLSLVLKELEFIVRIGAASIEMSLKTFIYVGGEKHVR